jgi:hypothetical protein
VASQDILRVGGMTKLPSKEGQLKLRFLSIMLVLRRCWLLMPEDPKLLQSKQTAFTFIDFVNARLPSTNNDKFDNITQNASSCSSPARK